MKLVSACLLGHNCKYNGGNNLNLHLVRLLKDEEIIPICPEELGGLPTPRAACEIINGSGNEVLLGKCRVHNKEGLDLTAEFLEGAEKTLDEAKKLGADMAILKSRSPSCGVGKIYDGSFSSTLKDGDGVTAALLKQFGLKVISDEEYIKGDRLDESN